MPPTFIPPVVLEGPTTVAEPHPGNALFRFFGPRRVGVNVYVLTNGTVTLNHPGVESLVATTYHGGHIHTVTAGEAAVLTAAGYEVT